MTKIILAASVAAAAAAAFAGPAAALSLVFDIHVTRVERNASVEGTGAFTPFSFQQTWTFGPGMASPFNDVFLGDPSLPITGGRLQGSASATPSPVILPLESEAAPSAAGGYDFGSGDIVLPLPTPNAIPGVVRAQVFEETLYPTDFGFAIYSRVTLEAETFGVAYPADEAGLAAYLGSRPLLWSQRTGSRTFDSLGDIPGRAYFGIAVLAPPVVSPPLPTGAVPEPASWALMIIGFGGVGALARRRRPAATSPA